jgi:hypothetical protein
MAPMNRQMQMTVSADHAWPGSSVIVSPAMPGAAAKASW